jgi:hypothetical protein
MNFPCCHHALVKTEVIYGRCTIVDEAMTKEGMERTVNLVVGGTRIEPVTSAV